MKALILIFSLLLIGNTGFCQAGTLPSNNLSEGYSDTVSAPGTKDELYARAKEYLAKNTAVKKDIIQMDDANLGRLIANSISMERDQFSDMLGYTYTVKFTTAIAVKAGKYKYVINNIVYDDTRVTPKRAASMIKKVISELSKAMSTNSQLEF